MNFKKVVLGLLIALFISSSVQAGKVFCSLPQTGTELVGFGLLMSGTVAGLLTIRQGLMDLLACKPQEAVADRSIRWRGSLKKFAIRSVVSLSLFTTGFSLLNCSMHGIDIKR